MRRPSPSLERCTALGDPNNAHGSSAGIGHNLPMQASGSTLRILGPVEVIGPAGPVRLGAAKERCLLAVLALLLGESVGQDELAEAPRLRSPPLAPRAQSACVSRFSP
jgi:hypothetical protein